MSSPVTPGPSLQAVYDNLWRVRDLEDDAFFKSIPTPRGPEFLLDMVADLKLEAGFSALDVGCGQGNYACQLAERFGAEVVASDPLEANLELARAAVTARGLEANVKVEAGTIEAIAHPDASFDVVWCRGVLIHVAAVEQALRECYRVLRPGGAMLLMLCSATDALSTAEAERLCAQMSFVAANLTGRSRIEGLLTTVGFHIERQEELSGELAEHYQALDGRCAEDLVRISRLQRCRDDFIARFGADCYETVLGMCSWQVYQLLGKISYKAYILRKP